MTTKTLTGAYPSGYYLAPAYSTLEIANTAVVGGPGVTTSASQPSIIANLGSVTGAAAGVDLADGGTVVNGAAGATAASIVGTVGIYAAGRSAGVTNFATIRSVAVTTYTGSGYDQVTIAANGPAIALSHGGRLTNSGVAALVYGGLQASVAPATVSNGGTIAGGKFSQTSKDRYESLSSGQAYAIELALGGRVNNAHGGLISGGIESSGLATVTNRGTISGAVARTVTGDVYGEEIDTATNQALSLRAGGALTNMAGGYIGGVNIAGGVGLVINYGGIGATALTAEYVKNGPEFSVKYQGYSVLMSQGGSIANGSQARGLASISSAIDIFGGAGFVDNFGAIGATTKSTHYLGVLSGSTGPSIQLGAGGEVVNGGPATSASIASGVYFTGAAGTVVNYGSIGAGRSYNNGAITGFDNSGWSVVVAAGGSLDNRNSASHVGSGVSVAGGAGTVLNQGVIGQRQTYNRYRTPAPTILTTESYSVVLSKGGLVVNGGTLLGGVSIDGGSGTVVNTGVMGAASSTYVQTKTTTIINKGTIGYSVVLSEGGSVTNGSMVATGADLADGVSISQGTLTNFATIGAGTSGVAIRLGAAVDRLIEEGSGRTVGKVIGNGGALELGAVAGAGTIGGIGGTITGFSTIAVDAGAGWHLTGSNTINNKATLTNAAAIVDDGTVSIGGSAELGALVRLSTGAEFTITGSGMAQILGDTGITAATGATGTRVLNNGVLEKVGGGGISNLVAATITNGGTILIDQGTLNVQGSVNGGGQIVLGAGATVELRNSMTAAGTVRFSGAGGMVELNDAAGFKAKIAGFGAGETLDLSSIAFKAGESLAYSGTTASGVLTVTSGASVAKIAMLGQFAAANFALSSDGHGGTDVTYVTTPTAAPALAAPGH